MKAKKAAHIKEFLYLCVQQPLTAKDILLSDSSVLERHFCPKGFS